MRLVHRFSQMSRQGEGAPCGSQGDKTKDGEVDPP